MSALKCTDIMQSDAGVAEWLKRIDIFGIAFVDGCPSTPEDTAALAKRIAFIRESHYGSLWDFTSNMDHMDTAYTNFALQAHTDTTYFTDPVGLQLFHLLQHNGNGGKSLFVDGFYCAELLKSQNPTAYHILSTLRVPTACAGDDAVTITPSPCAYPILNHHPITNELFQIRFNNDDRSVLNTMSVSDCRDFYHALRVWMSIVRDSENEFWTQLKPGTVVAFNNWRVLHGRSAFTGKRRMVGCYINYDDYRSRLTTLCDKNSHKGDL